MHCKSYSHFFSKKFQHICVSLDVNFNESLTKDIVSFEQLGPGVYASSGGQQRLIILGICTCCYVSSLDAHIRKLVGFGSAIKVMSSAVSLPNYTIFLDRLRPPSGAVNQYLCTFFRQNLKTVFLGSAEGRRKYDQIPRKNMVEPGGTNPRASDHQSDSHPTEPPATRYITSSCCWYYCCPCSKYSNVWPDELKTHFTVIKTVIIICHQWLLMKHACHCLNASSWEGINCILKHLWRRWHTSKMWHTFNSWPSISK